MIATSNVETAAHIAGLGFDFLWVEMEHSPISLESLRDIVLATRGLPAVPFARPRSTSSGPPNACSTKASRRNLSLHQLARTGRARPSPRATIPRRPARLGRLAGPIHLALARSDYYDSADDNIVVIAMIEDARPGKHRRNRRHAGPRRAVHRHQRPFLLARPARSPGPSASSARPSHKIAAAGQKDGKFLGRPAWNAGEVQTYIEQGFQFFMTRTELDLLTAGARQLLAPLQPK